MSDAIPNLMGAVNSTERVEALCRFIEFWLGTRRPEFGEQSEAFVAVALPMPLQRLYEFAGRWPAVDGQSSQQKSAFDCQDHLVPLDKVEYGSDGRLTFLCENQGCWCCRTLDHGDDPPVWCEGDYFDDEGDPVEGEQMVCESLSRFLVTFVLQEMTLSSRCTLSDAGLSSRFKAEISQAVPVWLDGPYVHGSGYNFYLWNNLLAAHLWGDYFFGANDPAGIEFLTANQGPVRLISLMVHHAWRLEIEADGSAKISYREWPIEEEASLPESLFDFDSLREQLTALADSEMATDPNVLAFFHRQGQNFAEGQRLNQAEIALSLFRRAIAAISAENDMLAQLFLNRWPYR